MDTFLIWLEGTQRVVRESHRVDRVAPHWAVFVCFAIFFSDLGTLR